MFSVVLSSEAKAFYESADAPLAKKLAKCFEHLEASPRTSNNIKRLSGDFSGWYRYRVSDWRVIYEIMDAKLEVFVLIIAHRRDVYE